MDALENLYYGLGQLAYAVAMADGEVQKEEKRRIHDIVVSEVREKESDIDISSIIFDVLEKEGVDVETAYSWAMDAIRLGDHHLTDIRKALFVAILRRIAEAFPPETIDEKELIERFKKDIGAE